MGKFKNVTKMYVPSRDFDMEVIVEKGSITPQEIWEQKAQWTAEVAASKEIWDSMGEDFEAVERMVVSGIERMHDNVKEWLPEAMEMEGGDFLDVKLRFIFTDIERDMDRYEQATSFQIESATNQSRSIIEEFQKGSESRPAPPAELIESFAKWADLSEDEARSILLRA